ncbi:MAG: chromate transporter [Erysipelotrichaceae bacterium]
MIYLQLLYYFILIGISAFGGGYAAMPLIQYYIVDKTHWIDMLQLADISSISQMTPGPILLNAATFVGVKMAGVLGGVLATLGSVLPSFIFVLLLSYLFKKYKNIKWIQSIMKGLKPAIVGLIGVATLTLIMHSLFYNSFSEFNLMAMLSFTIVLILGLKTKLSTVNLVLIGALIGLATYFIQ